MGGCPFFRRMHGAQKGTQIVQKPCKIAGERFPAGDQYIVVPCLT